MASFSRFSSFISLARPAARAAVLLALLVAAANGQAPIRIREADSNPNVPLPKEIIFPNGSLTQNGRSLTVTLSGGTVTNTGTLTGNAFVLGNSGVDVKPLALTGLVLGNGASAPTAVTTSAGLASVLSDETGSGSAVFATAPVIAGGSLTGLTALAVRSTGTGAFDLTIANAENLTAGRTLTFAVGDAARTLTISGNATVSGTNTGDQTITLTGDVTGSGSGSFATIIGAGKVTNAMLAGSIASSKLIGTDITTLGAVTTGTWSATTIAVDKGGTGQTTYTDGQLLIGNTATGGLSKATLTAGTNITITNGPGSITIAAAGGGGAPYSDAFALVKNSADATKLMIFSAAGVTTGTTRTYTGPNASGTLSLIDLAQTWTAAQTFGSQLLIATSPKITTSINDANGNELVGFTSTASAVNEPTIVNAATGNAPQIQATGGDANIDLKFTPKGAGKIVANATILALGSDILLKATGDGTLRVRAAADNDFQRIISSTIELGDNSAALHAGYGGIAMNSVRGIRWTSDSVYYSTADTGLARDIANYVRLTNGSTGPGGLTIDEMSANPANPTQDTQIHAYMKADKLVIQFNNGGTVRYFTLDLTQSIAAPVWAQSTTAP